jgi:hypothetical protein
MEATSMMLLKASTDLTWADVDERAHVRDSRTSANHAILDNIPRTRRYGVCESKELPSMRLVIYNTVEEYCCGTVYGM